MSEDTKTPRPDETPATFEDLKPPGYWSATLGYFVPVRMVTEQEFWEDKDTLKDCLAMMAQRRCGH